jgi:crotonobetainyl-CoA:carnitine CoA-transferase CaiB-like acyl-CoA transferase
MTETALEGIKILDLSKLASGPYCTMLLGDMGAEIIKIEAGGGRAGESFLPGIAEDEENQNIANAAARNKRSIVLNLKTEEAREIFYRLAKEADVIVEEFRPGVVKRLGIDYETIRKTNPRIIYCSITGFGQDGPYSNLASHDINYLSIGGAQGILGNPGGAPVPQTNIIADFAAGGMQATIGILTALMARNRTGKGQHVDISITDGIVSLMHAEVALHFAMGRIPRPGDTLFFTGAPWYAIYETKDGKYLSVGSLEPWFWENLCKSLGVEDMIPDQWAGEPKWKEMKSRFQEVFLTKTRDEWVELLMQENTCVAPVYSVDEIFTDPQLRSRNMFEEFDHPTKGKVKQVGISIKLSETPGAIRRLGPRKGEHTQEILQEIGYSKDKVADLRKKGVIA